MKKYEVILDAKAAKTLKKIKDEKLLRSIANTLDLLSTNYLSIGKPLLGEWKGCYSIRNMSFRIIFEVIHNKRIVYVLNIGHRSKIYRKRK